MLRFAHDFIQTMTSLYLRDYILVLGHLQKDLELILGKKWSSMGSKLNKKLVQISQNGKKLGLKL